MVPASPTATNWVPVQATPRSRFVVPDVRGVHDARSVEEIIAPTSPTATAVVPEAATPLRWKVIPELLEVHVIPSVEVRIVPSPPTATACAEKSPMPKRVLPVPEVRPFQKLGSHGIPPSPPPSPPHPERTPNDTKTTTRTTRKRPTTFILPPFFLRFGIDDVTQASPAFASPMDGLSTQMMMSFSLRSWGPENGCRSADDVALRRSDNVGDAMSLSEHHSARSSSNGTS